MRGLSLLMAMMFMFSVNVYARTHPVERVLPLDGGTVALYNRDGTITANDFMPASQILHISPMVGWLSIPAAGGAHWSVMIASSTQWNVSARPDWLDIQWIDGGFRLTAQQNNTTSTRSGLVTVRAGNLERSFAVTQLAGA